MDTLKDSQSILYSSSILLIGKIAIPIVYVDDIVLTGDFDEDITKLKKFLPQEFEIKGLVILEYFQGMEVARTRKGIAVSQRKYTLDLLKETEMLGCKPADMPDLFAVSVL